MLLAVPDPAVPGVAASLAAHVRPGQAFLHASGSLPPSALDVCAEAGAATGACHPLASFADPSRPPTLAGVTFVLAGAPEAVTAGRRIAFALGARVIARPVHGPAYHAAAALCANGAAALTAVAARVLSAGLSVEARSAERAMGALLRTVGENVERLGFPQALSGPVVRGDDGTVRGHRTALSDVDRDALDAYDAVAPAILDLARRAGLPPDRIAAIRAALDED